GHLRRTPEDVGAVDTAGGGADADGFACADGLVAGVAGARVAAVTILGPASTGAETIAGGADSTGGGMVSAEIGADDVMAGGGAETSALPALGVGGCDVARRAPTNPIAPTSAAAGAIT